MLSQYRRHTKTCCKNRAQHDRSHNDCRCVIYVEGKLTKYARYIKESSGFRNWQTVRKLIVAAEEQGVWPPTTSGLNVEPAAESLLSRGVSVSQAVAGFMVDANDEKGRNIRPATVSKYRTLLGRLVKYCLQGGIEQLTELSTERLQSFKASWITGARATGNNVQRLRCFFCFCVERQWLEINPAQRLKIPKNIRPTQKMPFTESEMGRILEAAIHLRLNVQQRTNNGELSAFILLMRYTGLRISDVGLLTVERIKKGQIFLYAQKNGALVFCPLPPWVADVVNRVAVKPNGYLFCTGSTRLETVVEVWSERLRQVFRAAGVQKGTSHRFRHTFAVDLLLNGTSVKNVSILLGHDSVLTTEQHYSAWISERQEALTADVMNAYARGQRKVLPLAG